MGKQSRKTRRQESQAPARAPIPPANPVTGSASEPAPELPPLPEMLTPGVLIPMLALMIVIGTWGLLSGIATIKGNEMSKYQAIFSATNAATLTGFQQARNPNDYTLFGQILTLVLMLSGIIFSFVAGGLAVVRIARLRFTHRQVIGWAIGSTLVVGIVGGLLLHEKDRSFFQACYLAISAFGNCGLFLGSLPVPTGARAQLLVLPLALLGGLGLPVLMEMVNWINGRRAISKHSRTTLVWSAGVYATIAILLILLRAPPKTAGPEVWQHVIAAGTREAINARSAGFPFEFASYFPQTAAIILILVMIIGAAPAGTGGGIKVTTIAMLTDGVRNLLTRKPTGRPLGIALLWTSIYLAMLLIATLTLTITEPEFHLDRTLFLAASALGNVGLSHDPIVASDAGLCVLSATMLLGRIAPVLMLWYSFESTPEATIATA